MGIWEAITGGAAKGLGEGVAAAVDSVARAGDALFTSDEERAEYALKIKELQFQLNLADAKSSNWFQAGWRPAMGWVGAIGMLACYVVMPVVNGFADVNIVIPIDHVEWLVLLLLGGATVRSYDKKVGTVR